MQKPPPFVLTEAVHTTAIAPPGFPPQRETEDELLRSGMFYSPRNHSQYEQQVQSFIVPLENEYTQKTGLINQTIEADLARARLEGTTHPLPAAESITRELGVRNTVIQRKNLEYQQHTAIAQRFYGEDPLGKTAHQFIARAATFDRHMRPNGPAFTQWRQSYRSAHEARLLAQTLAVLHQQQINVQNWLNSVQANNQTQAAAAQTQRLAAERERIAAEQQRQRAVAEKARRDQEEIRVREQERLATLAEARRLAEQLARTTAEAAARQVRAEKARLEELAEKSRQAEAENLRLERAHRAQKEQREHQREKALLAEQAVIRQQAEKNRRERLLQAELEAQERRRAQAALDAEAEATRQA